MIVFLAIYFLVYGSVHFYFFSKVKTAYALSPKFNLLIILFLALMVLAPILTRSFERIGWIFPARFVGHIGYLWMGFLFLFFCIALTLDIYRLLVYLAGWMAKNSFSSLLPTARWTFGVATILAVVISIYGFFEARSLDIERLTISSRKIPAEVGAFKIVQISDLHLGLTVGERWVEKVAAVIESENPDLLVSSGDLVDASASDLDPVVVRLKALQPRYGKFAVTGNHEFYAGIGQAAECTQRAGFVLLRNGSANILGFLSIVGVDDPAGAMRLSGKVLSEEELLRSLPAEQYTILLKHRPTVNKETISLFDLQLSGHTHKGQIFPFNLLTKLFFITNAGYLKLSPRSYIYVSRGTGTWGPPIRFLSPPELTVITLMHALTPE